ncbi:MAG: hypothetical protein GF370_03235 [Candidatus Nealsonbacteria bacterium]|nr:hypothetical protein [Candidatus Nealsonbacteria bacterium]
MEETTLQERIQKISLAEGKTRGVVMKPDIQFIIRKRGREGVEQVENEMEKLGVPLDLDNIRISKYYPIGIRTIFLLTAKRILGFSDQDMREMGTEVPKFSSIMRFFMKSFLMDENVFFQKAPSYWEKFVSVGEVTVPYFDAGRNVATVRLDDFNIDPVFCPYVEGVFSSFVKIITGANKVHSKETECSFKGGDYHEFELSW